DRNPYTELSIIRGSSAASAVAAAARTADGHVLLQAPQQAPSPPLRTSRLCCDSAPRSNPPTTRLVAALRGLQLATKRLDDRQDSCHRADEMSLRIRSRGIPQPRHSESAPALEENVSFRLFSGKVCPSSCACAGAARPPARTPGLRRSRDRGHSTMQRRRSHSRCSAAACPASSGPWSTDSTRRHCRAQFGALLPGSPASA
ncbi:hypothetical protein M885DRAFT_597279, partial [Pelagophyceae sp. CCMP2097]